MRQIHTAFHVDILERYEWDHVNSPDARMTALMSPKVYLLDRDQGCLQESVLNRLRLSNQAHDQTIVILVSPIIDKAAPFPVPKRLDNSLDDFLVSAFAEIGDAFN
jgi:hypothetical protein